jgi:hypothetical protein
VLEQRPIIAGRNEIPVGEAAEKSNQLALGNAQQNQARFGVERIAGDGVLPFGLAVRAAQILRR